MNEIINSIREELENNIEESIKNSGKRYFKEEIKLYGVSVSFVTKLSKKYFELIKDFPKKEIFAICEELWKSGYSEENYIACNFSYYINKNYESSDFQIFENWLQNYVTNWATCDTFCNHTIGTFLEMYPDYLINLKSWAKSQNRWFRRAAAVSLIIPARKGLFLNEILEIAEILLLDKDDLVQKGYGWLLKAASLSEKTAKAKKLSDEIRKEHLEAVFDFVISKKAIMPRTSLRYAIEKMPQELKIEAMKK
jgi:3-methyladenine DNA glycosylase AlkD